MTTISITDTSGTNQSGALSFDVTLDAASASTVTVDYATAPNTATSGVDFKPKSGKLIFYPGQTTKSIPITVYQNDTHPEPTSGTYEINLYNPTNATISDFPGIGTLDLTLPSTLSMAMSQALAGNGNNASGAITTVASASRSSGTAPCAIFFDATATTTTLGIDTFSDILYLWNFGDGEIAWTYGTHASDNSKNRARGAVAAHVYESAGSFVAKVTPIHVSSGGALHVGATVSLTTVVTAADTTYSGANTICVANGAAPVPGVNGVPIGATCVGSITTVTAALSAAGINTGSGAANKRLLFKRGDTFNVTADDYIRKSGGIIGAFGSGANPVIQFTSNNRAFYLLSADHWSFMDLDFIGSGGFRHMIVGTNDASGSNILMLRLTATATAGAEPGGTGIFMVDCNLHELVGGNGFVGFYSQMGSKIVALGNRIYDCSAIEHNIRFQGCTKIVISNNTLYRAASTKHLITIRGRSNQISGHIETWSGVWTEHVIISDNDMDAGSTLGGGWITHFGAQNSGADERTRSVIFERNYTRGNVASHIMTEALENVTIRNNLFYEEFNGTYTAGTILITARSLIGMPSASDTSIYNNTIYQKSGAHAYFEAVVVDKESGSPATVPTGTVLSNNLVYAPTATGTDYAGGAPILIGSYNGATWTLNTNSTNSQIKNTAPGFAVPPTTFSDWKPTTGYAINSGTYVPVFDDFYGLPRATTMSLGAIQP